MLLQIVCENSVNNEVSFIVKYNDDKALKIFSTWIKQNVVYIIECFNLTRQISQTPSFPLDDVAIILVPIWISF